ncbi:MAG: RNA polymerase sporulation sigma factor SigK [Eubacteriales bacterium]|nr:RNA polymerase sporulation sigma factor SigK [Eubacteriales bacterium]MDY4898494.1 RNA polymerase sporulation sigma factor SigK [Eubacteriales bacterium]
MYTYIFSLLSHMLGAILGVGTPHSFPPPLSPDDEADCFKRMRQGDKEARQLLILHNLRLVAHIVRKYYSGSRAQEDLISVGSIGLVKAVDSFDNTKTTKFATYAAKCIQNEVLMFFRSQKKQAGEVSINETIDMDRDGNPLTYIDVISCDDSVVEEVDLKMQTDRMLCYINTVLSPRERQIIIMRYGLYGGQQYTQHETAERLGISRSYVSRIEKGALDKLFAAFTGENR